MQMGRRVSCGPMAFASSTNFFFSFSGSGVSGAITLTYGSATDSKYPTAYEITEISGTFSDANIGVSNASVTGLTPINNPPATPEPGNNLAPHDFSRFAVASGLPSINNGFLTYDNLYWPGGSPQTAFDYPFGGGFLDIYGLMFTITGGDVVDFFSYGYTPAPGPIYGVAVATSAQALDYVGGVDAVPEPSTWLTMLLGFAGLGFVGHRTSRRRAPAAA